MLNELMLDVDCGCRACSPLAQADDEKWNAKIVIIG